MPGPETPQVLLQLAAARSAIDAAIGLLAGPQLAMPAGVERPPGPCAHPRTQATMGGNRMCLDCGEQWHETKGSR